jgi:DNA-binding MarR family transcriptional regulator
MRIYFTRDPRSCEGARLVAMRRRDHVHRVLEQWRREAPELDRSPFGVIGRISRLAHLLQAKMEPIFAAHGVTGGEFDVLAALRRTGHPYRLHPTKLSRQLIVTSGGMTKRLNALSVVGWFRRESNPNDRRSSAVLTSAGKHLAEAILPEDVANERRLVGLSGKQRHDLAGLLEDLAVSLGDLADVRIPGTTPARRTQTA